MKISKVKAVALFVSLGFTKAGDWDDEKLIKQLGQVPSKVEQDDIKDDDLVDLYKDLVEAAENEEELTLTSDKDKDEDPEKDEKKDDKDDADPKPAPKKPAAKADPPLDKMSKAQLVTFAEEEELDVKITKKLSLADTLKLVKKAYAAKKPAPAAKSNPVPKKSSIDLDKFGSRVGTISHKVNQVMSKDWQDEDAIVKASGLTRNQALGRLYYGREAGQFEVRRLIQYRVVAKSKE